MSPGTRSPCQAIRPDSDSHEDYSLTVDMARAESLQLRPMTLAP